MNTRVRLWIAFGLVATVIAGLIGVGISKSASYNLTVAQVYQDHPSAAEPVTVAGQIVGNSVSWEPSHVYLQFSIHDAGSPKTLRVLYHGLRPDDFTNGWPVIVTGTVGSNGILQASQLEIKCPSKYDAKSQA